MNTAWTQNQITSSCKNCESPASKPRISRVARIAGQRLLSDSYALWRLCEKTACWRAGHCKGEPSECLGALTPLLAPNVIDGAFCMFEGKQSGLSFDEIYARHPDEALAFAHWRLCIERRSVLPRGCRTKNGGRVAAPSRAR